MDEKHISDDALEAMFDTARAAPPEMPEGLMARVIADAGAVQPARSIWARLFEGPLEGVGGIPGLGGLVTATCVGVWLGVAPPANVPDLAGQILGVETLLEDEWDTVDMTEGLTSFGWDMEEG